MALWRTWVVSVSLSKTRATLPALPKEEGTLSSGREASI